MKQTLTTLAKLVAVLLLVLVAVHPLLWPTLPWSDDGQLHFWRVVELDRCLRNGYFYPRWMPDMAYGYGYPLLNYYAPLSVYLAEGFHLLGLDFTSALLAAFSTTLALGALGAYLWARETFGEAGGIVAAVAYAYAPYTLYDAIWRGNLAESLALGVLPWVFWRLRRLSLHRSRRALALAALACASLVLSHNITALIVAPLLAGYVLLLWWTTGRSHKALGLFAGALGLGLALSAFFWLPAFFERAFAQTIKMVTTSHFDYRHNFLELGELLSPPLPVDVTLMNPPVPRSLGWPVLVLAALGVVGSWKIGKLKSPETDSRVQWESLGAGAALVLCTFLTLAASRFLWQRTPLLPYVGFPWRFLGPAGLMAAWLAGATAQWTWQWRPAVQAWGLGLTVLAIVAFSLTWLYPRYLGPMDNLTPAGLIAFEQSSGALGTTSVGEYLPAWVKELPDTRAMEAQYRTGGSIRRLVTESLPEGAAIVSETWRLVGGDVTVNSPSDWTATLRQFYFPGWRVWLNGVETETTPTLPHGLLRFPVPAGETHIRVRFGSTPWRLVGTVLSAAGLVALAALVINPTPSRSQPACDRQPGHVGLAQSAPSRSKLGFLIRRFAPIRPVLNWLFALVAVGVVFVTQVSYLDAHDSPVRHAGFDGQKVKGVGAPMQVRFDDDIRLLGYDPKTLTVESGGSLSLYLYWTADTPPDEEYSSFLHLVDAGGHRWGQSDNQHPGGYPTARWRPGEYNRDAHVLTVLPGTPPGNYTLRAGLVGRTTGVGLDVLDERGAPAGTSVAIGTITVTRSQRPPPVETLDMAHHLDARLGDLMLLGLSLDRYQAAPGDILHLTLYWRAERALSQGQAYACAISVRMLGGDDQIVVETALPLAATAYPSNQWGAGEVVRGQHWLTLPASLNSGTYAIYLQVLNGDGGTVGVPVSPGEAGQITVITPERQTAIPPMRHRLDVNLGDRVTLLGYDLEPETAHPGETLCLTLYWRAERTMTRSYAVFAHLLDAESRIVAQHDGLPVNWTRPTTGWLSGEVITDVHELVLETGVPSGVYLLEIGLYDPETNVRLPVLDAAGQIIEDRALLAPVSVESKN